MKHLFRDGADPIVGSAFATLISYTFAVLFIGFFPSTKGQFILAIKSIIFVNMISYLKSYFKNDSKE
ncbi:MAG: hypothetical protein P8X47_12285 [Ignavibacteriaceae bacterium]